MRTDPVKRRLRFDFEAAAVAIRQAASQQFAFVNGPQLLDDLVQAPAKTIGERVCYRIGGCWLPLVDAASELVRQRGLPNGVLPVFLESSLAQSLGIGSGLSDCAKFRLS